MKFSIFRKIVRFFIIFSFTLLPSYSQSQESGSLADLAAAVKVHKEAIRYIDANQFDKAQVLLEEMLKLYPQSAAVRNNLGYVLFKRGNENQAIKLLEEGVSTSPLYDSLYRNIQEMRKFNAAKSYALATNNAVELPPVNFNLVDIDVVGEVAEPKSFTYSRISKTTTGSDKMNTAVNQPTTNNPPKIIKQEPQKQVSEQENNVEPVELQKSESKQGTSSDTEQEKTVRSKVIAWAKAWEEGDINKYMAHYSRLFKPQSTSLPAWIKERSERVTPARKAKIKLHPITVNFSNDGLATANFQMDYSSSTYNSKTPKTLVMENSNGQWKIVSESGR